MTILINARKKDGRFIDRKYHAKQPCGYCWMKKHKGFLTVDLMKKHKCLERKCHYFQKYEQHSYWKQLETEKQKRRERRSRERRLYGYK